MSQDKQKLIQTREHLMALRNEECLGSTMDADGAIILSHAIRWLWFKIEDKPYAPTTD